MDGDFNASRWRGPAAVLNQRVCKIDPDERYYDLRFLSYVLPGYLDAINAETSAITVKHLSSRTVGEIPLPLPPLPEQHRIVAAIEEQFTRLDAAVASLGRARANLKRYRAAVLAAACSGRLIQDEAESTPTEGNEYNTAAALVAQIVSEQASTVTKKNVMAQQENEEILPDLPRDWVWASVAQLASAEQNAITDGPFGSNLKTSHYTASGPRVIRLQNIGDGAFVDAEAHISEEHYQSLRKHHVAPGDIVIAALGETLPRACVIPSSVGPAIVKADCVRFRPHRHVAPQFLNYALNAKSTRERTSAIIHGVGRPRLNLGEIKSIMLPVAPPDTQHRIVAEVERRLSIVDDMEASVAASLKRAGRLRQAVLRRAFAGELVPQDPSHEPASALLERIRAERATTTTQGSTRRRTRRVPQPPLR